MGILTETQIKEGYFYNLGCFPKARLVTDYNGDDKLCIACTQLDYEGYSKSEQRKILTEWINFLQSNTKVFRALHFYSHVPQALFNAACCQENLIELRFKWESYSNLLLIYKLNAALLFV